MIEPCCFVSKLPAVFLLLAALTGFTLAKLHRCLREFDPSNCNALEEVWAFDAEGQRCIEMVYGGCGKPQRLSNRFESHEECMQSCGPLGKGASVPSEGIGDEDEVNREGSGSESPSASSHKGDESDGVQGFLNVLSHAANHQPAKLPHAHATQPSSSNYGRHLPTSNLMGTDHDYRIRPHHRGLVPIEAAHSGYPPLSHLGHIVYGPMAESIIQPQFHVHAPMYAQGQGPSSDVQYHGYHGPMFNAMPGESGLNNT